MSKKSQPFGDPVLYRIRTVANLGDWCQPEKWFGYQMSTGQDPNIDRWKPAGYSAFDGNSWQFENAAHEERCESDKFR